MVVIYTDGSCKSANCLDVGPGAFAWARVEENKVIADNSDSCGNVTHNRAEMIAIIKALIANDDFCLTIVSDSQIIVKGATKQEQRENNLDLWNQIDKLTNYRDITWEWSKHRCNQWNNYVDWLALAACPT